MFKNRYNLIILVLGLVFVLGGCLKKEVKPAVKVKPVSVVEVEEKSDEKVEKKENDIDTSDWLTYWNEEYKIEFKYPPSLVVKNWADNTPNYEILLYIGDNKYIGDGAMSIGIDKDITNFNPETIMWPIPRSDLNIQDAIIGQDDYLANKVFVDIHTVDGDIFVENHYVRFNNKLYQISYNKEKNNLLDQNIFESILKTLKLNN